MAGARAQKREGMRKRDRESRLGPSILIESRLLVKRLRREASSGRMGCIHFHELSTPASRLDRVLLASASPFLSFWPLTVSHGHTLHPSLSLFLSLWDVYIILLVFVVPSRCSLSDLRGGRQGRREPRHHVLCPPQSRLFSLRIPDSTTRCAHTYIRARIYK